jgi:hypothetical protein
LLAPLPWFFKCQIDKDVTKKEEKQIVGKTLGSKKEGGEETSFLSLFKTFMRLG